MFKAPQLAGGRGRIQTQTDEEGPPPGFVTRCVRPEGCGLGGRGTRILQGGSTSGLVSRGWRCTSPVFHLDHSVTGSVRGCLFGMSEMTPCPSLQFSWDPDSPGTSWCSFWVWLTRSDDTVMAVSTVIPKIQGSPNSQDGSYIRTECDQVMKQLLALDTCRGDGWMDDYWIVFAFKNATLWQAFFFFFS